MSGQLDYEGFKFNHKGFKKVNDPITVEKALQISINGKSFTVVMQTPGSELELAVGLLYSEDVLKLNSTYTHSFEKDENGAIEIVNFAISEQDLGKGYLSSRSLLSVSSCGICGKQSLSDLTIDGNALKPAEKLSPHFIFDLQTKMHKAQAIFPHTGSIHGAAIFNPEGALLTCQEDIGRHNALDKAIGDLILTKKQAAGNILFFSGRISYEIVIKSFRAKIHTIIAISGPSSLAIDYAKEFGINLIGFCRDGRFTVYTEGGVQRD
ncbi:MAG: formate dehydrogenase accessory sulfurtransferase FdhD [Putridiphycobacter sp.]|nr:formate dehydrogenase accessory sulfurtransferase FdhD [Putridiphycobacter sp.]